jgi:hypothetical protein
MFKTQKPQIWIVCIFLNIFLPTKCAPFLLKIEKDFNIEIKRAKGFELMKTIFITHLNTFSSKVPLTLKIMSFENMALTICSYICDRGHQCMMYMI